MNLYADLTMFRDMFVEGQALDAGDARQIEDALKAGSRRVDSHCKREFFASYGTRVFRSCGQDFVRLPDLISAAAVAVDTDDDGDFDETLTGSDYVLEREFAEDIDATPKTVIRLLSGGSLGTFPVGKRALQIEGLWGFTDNRETLVSLLAEALDTSETAVTVDDGDEFAVGQTLRLTWGDAADHEWEDVYVSAVAADVLTVARGVNGTTAHTHLDNAAIERYVYVPEVVQAALIYSGRLWKRREASYANVISNEVSGTTSVYRASDPDVEGLLAPLVRWSV